MSSERAALNGVYPADERWMRSIDIPSLHLILDAYSSAVKKTGWIAKLGRTIQNRILQRMLKTQIRRFASSSESVNLRQNT